MAETEWDQSAVLGGLQLRLSFVGLRLVVETPFPSFWLVVALGLAAQTPCFNPYAHAQTTASPLSAVPMAPLDVSDASLRNPPFLDRPVERANANGKVASAALPDAPNPTDTVLGADGISSSLTGLYQQGGQGGIPADQSRESQQNPGTPSPPSLEDLGFPPEQTNADPDTQARLDRRTRMFKIHQRLGLITLAPLAAACISSAAAPPDPRKGKENTVGRDINSRCHGL
jgi:hypothetical protein